MGRSDALVEALAEAYLSRFRAELGSLRQVGREAEYPLVWPDGTAGDASLLWEPLLDQGGLEPRYEPGELLVEAQGERVRYSLEVGRGTFELSLGPCQDLWELLRLSQEALARAAQAAASSGMSLLGFGIQPRTRPSPRQMTPRRHYQALHRALGPAWLGLTTTAAEQVHVDITRSELLAAVNGLNLLAGCITALCANSSVHSGRAGWALAGREAILSALGEHRYGMLPGPMQSVEALIAHLSSYRCYVLPEGNGYRRVRGSFLEHVRNGGDGHSRRQRFEDFLWHEHYIWNVARARPQYSTIEVRPACQQPGDAQLAASALALGLVESLPQAVGFLADRLEPDPWPAMAAYRREAIRLGLGAQEPVPELLSSLLHLAEAGLARRGRGEQRFLAPLWERLARRESPGQVARRTLRSRGMPALLAELRVSTTREVD
jgi:gamma-glutamylcysteine synthetase